MSAAESVAMAVGLGLAPLCAAGLCLAPPRRAAAALLVGVFAGAGAVITFDQQLRIGVGLLVTGVFAAAILNIGLRRADWPERHGEGGSIVGGRLFRGATVLLVAVAVWGLTVPYASTLGVATRSRLVAAAMTMAMGLLQLGFSQEQGAAALGLLTSLAGFELLYVALEPSLALRAVLAGIMLGIAVVSSVLLGLATPVEEGRRQS